jgi:hypothetical protein
LQKELQETIDLLVKKKGLLKTAGAAGTAEGWLLTPDALCRSSQYLELIVLVPYGDLPSTLS